MEKSIGYLTLRRIAPLKNVNAYLISEIIPHITGEDILEVGSGVGTYTESFIKIGKNVVSIDIAPQMKEILRRKFGSRYPAFEFVTGDISCDGIFCELNKKFDTILCLNVLEHIKDDEKALINMRKLLKPNGTLILQVPAIKFLYGTLDENLGHYRRYSYAEIKEMLQKIGFSVKKHFYLYFIGILGWYLRSKVTKEIAIGKEDLKIYNAMTCLFKFIDKITFRSIGQSLIVVCKVD